jgi:uncharacterized protein with beta-barrel porin domain
MTVYDSLENTVTVSVTISVQANLGVNPTSLNLSGYPGQEVSGSVSISGGQSPYGANVSGPGQVTVSNNTATYSYSIPADASEGQFAAQMTVYDSLENTVTVSVTISIQASLRVNPTSLNLSGYPGREVSGSVSISGGQSPYGANVSGPGQVTVSNNTATYSYSIPADASEGQLSAQMVIRDNLKNSETVSVTINVKSSLKAEPSTKNLTGYPGQKTEGSVTISGGAPPYSAIISDGSGEVKVSDSTVLYSLKIPSDTDSGQKFKELVVVTDAEENSINVRFEITVMAFKPLTDTLDLTPNQRQVAGTIEKISPLLNELENPTPEQEQLTHRFNALIESVETDPNSVKNAISQLTPDEAGTQAILTNRTAVQQLGNVTNRLTALRAGATGFDMSGLSFGIPGENYLAGLATDIASGIIGTSDDSDGIELMNDLGVFVTGRVSFGSQDSTRNQNGFDFDTLGVTAGIDYRFSKDLVIGIAGGYADTGVDYSNSGGDLDIDSWSASFYGNYYISENLYVDAIYNFGWNDYDQTRKVKYSLQNDIPIATRQNSDYSGDQYSVSAGAGYEFNFNALKLTLNGRINYIELKVDSYREKDSSNTGLNLYIHDQDTHSCTTTLGLDASYVLNTNIGVMIPKMAVEWEHEFQDDSFFIEGSFVNDPNPENPSVFYIETDDPSRDYFRLSPGMSMVFPHGINGFINFDFLVGYSKFESYNLSFGLRYEF